MNEEDSADNVRQRTNQLKGTEEGKNDPKGEDDNANETEEGKNDPKGEDDNANETEEGKRDLKGEDDNENETEEQEKALDFSGQGLTLLPATLFTSPLGRDVVFLNISGNNLRNLPPDISQLGLLKRLDVSRNPLRVNNVNDLSSLPLEMAEMSQLEEIILSECNLSYIPATIWHMEHLLKLDISRNRLSTLPSDIGGMSKLRSLNAQDTGISTLPPEIVCCERLESLLLYGNVITNLPDTLRDLKRLRQLTINYSYFCADIDESMENLLSKGKIQSEHIPPVVFQIPKLKMLSLDNCKLNVLPPIINEFLVETNLSKNFFSEIPPALCCLHKIVIIDLSHNQLSIIPDAFSQLSSLREFFCRANKLTSIGQSLCRLSGLIKLDLGNNLIRIISPEIGQLKSLQKLIIDNNQIESLPEQICDLKSLNTLDLTANLIQSLPTNVRFLPNLSVAHSYEGLFKVGLWLHKNPITAPPPTYWRCTHSDRIRKHLKKMEIQSIPNLQPIRIVVLGNPGSGKQSFVQSLLTRKPSTENNERLFDKDASFFSLQKWTTDNKIRFKLFNFNCYPVFEKLLCHFLDNNCLFLIVFDCSEFENEGFDSQIGCWLKILQIYAPGCTVKLVGGKWDQFVHDELQQITALDEAPSENENETVAGTLKSSSYVSGEGANTVSPTEEDQADKRPNSFQLRQNVLDSLARKEETLISQIKGDLSAFTSQYSSLASQWRVAALTGTDAMAFEMNFEMNETISLISTSEMMNGVEEFVEDLELVAINSKSFLNHHIAIPTEWNLLLASIKQYREDHKCYIKYDRVKEMALSVGLSHLDNALMHFHRCGQIFWLHRHPILKNCVLHKMNRLNKLLSTVIRTDFESYLNYDENAIFRCSAGLSADQFTECRDIFCKYGELSPSLLKCLSFYNNPSKKELKHIKKLLVLFEIGILMPRPQLKRGLYLHNQPIVILPQFASEPIPQEYYDTLKTANSPIIKTSKYEFPQGRPLNLFEILSVRLHPLVSYREDWNGLVLAKLNESQIILEESCLEESGEYVISMTVCGVEESLDLEQWFTRQIQLYRESVPGLIVCTN